jgi:hypothetical protein
VSTEVTHVELKGDTIHVREGTTIPSAVVEAQGRIVLPVVEYENAGATNVP